MNIDDDEIFDQEKITNCLKESKALYGYKYK